jgi:hypothetical protein
MERKNSYKLLFTLFLVVSVAIIFFFYRMYQHDVTALENFDIAYKNSDKAISDFKQTSQMTVEQLNKSAVLESKAHLAVKELKAKAVALSKLSSLIKNDGTLKNTATKLAGLAEKELSNVRLYKQMLSKPIQPERLDSIAKEFTNLDRSSKHTYVIFKSLMQ